MIKEFVDILILWDSADLNRGPSVPNARGWTKLPYYPVLIFILPLKQEHKNTF